MPPALADRLAARYGDLMPWPEAPRMLGALHGAVKLAVVTNCSQALGIIAAGRLGIAFDTVVTAERAGFYKPDRRPYQLALAELGVAPADALFVAGSAYDLVGAAAVGLPVYWHDRTGVAMPPEAPPPLCRERSLAPLLPLVLG